MFKPMNEQEKAKGNEAIKSFGLEIYGGTINSVSVAVMLTAFGKMNDPSTVSRDRTMLENVRKRLEDVFGLPVLIYN